MATKSFQERFATKEEYEVFCAHLPQLWEALRRQLESNPLVARHREALDAMNELEATVNLRPHT